jgi:hypothetical protein
MDFHTVLDSVSILSSLWGGLPVSPVCTSSPHVLRQAVGSPMAGARAGVTAFVNVNVVPMDTERVLTNQTVVVQDGRIIVLGPADKVKVPAGAVQVDGRGRYLMPGLGDMHTHVPNQDNYGQSIHRLLSYLANGVTTVRILGPIHPSHWPRILTGVEPMTMRNRPVEIPSPRLYLPEQTPGTVHKHSLSFEQVVTRDARGRSYEHLYAFLPQRDAAISDLQVVAGAAQRAGLWVTPTLNCQERNQSPDLPSARRAVKALQDAGVGLLVGADAYFLEERSPSRVHDELSALVNAGLTPYQALLAGTRNVAQYLGLLDSAGTVAVGKRADLVLLSDNPLTDIRHTREPAGVMIGGRWFDRVALDQGLLALPKTWLRLAVVGGVRPLLTEHQVTTLERRFRKFDELTDSLEFAPPTGRRGVFSYEDVLRRQAEEFGAIRAILTSEQHEAFDQVARVWLREQVRKGYSMTIPGIRAVP